MLTLACAVARDPRTSERTLTQLATLGRDKTGHLRALCATHPNVAPADAVALLADVNLSDAFSAPLLTDMRRQLIAHHAPLPALREHVEHTPTAHPDVVHILASRSGTRAQITITASAVVIATHPNSTPEDQVRALRRWVTAPGGSQSTRNRISYLAASHPEHLGELADRAHHAGQITLARTLRALQHAHASGNDPRELCRRTLADQAQTDPRCGAWVEAIEATGDPDVAGAALDAGGPPVLAATIVRHPALLTHPVRARALTVLLNVEAAAVMSTLSGDAHLPIGATAQTVAATLTYRDMEPVLNAHLTPEHLDIAHHTLAAQAARGATQVDDPYLALALSLLTHPAATVDQRRQWAHNPLPLPAGATHTLGQFAYLRASLTLAQVAHEALCNPSAGTNVPLGALRARDDVLGAPIHTRRSGMPAGGGDLPGELLLASALHPWPVHDPAFVTTALSLEPGLTPTATLTELLQSAAAISHP